MVEYSEGFRSKMVQRMTGPRGKTATALASEVGISAVEVVTSQKFVFQRHIALVKLLRGLVNATFVEQALNSPACFAQARATARGAAQPTVTLGDLSRFAVPIAPVDEQIVVVERLGRTRRVLIAFGKLLSDSIDSHLALDRATLSKAFRGELVPQDPNDEPASDLLARITSERDGTAIPKSNGRTAPEPTSPPTPPTPARGTKRIPAKTKA